MEEDCEFCRGEFENTRLKKYDNWTAELFQNQYYLGRCVVKHRDHKVDLTEIDNLERRQLFEVVVPEIKQVLDEIFSPDLYNYASLGNDCRHLHIIPRYSENRRFGKITFQDENWKSHYLPYDSDFDIPEEVFEKIRKTIIRRLE